MPPFILWSPLEQFGESYGITFTCPKCDVIPSELKAVGWQCGLKGSSTNPRVIHSVDSAVLVVGRTYRCSSSHTVLAYHPDLMQKLPKSLVPFQLWHRTGFTVKLINWIQSLVLAGVSLSAITSTLNSRRHECYYRRRETYYSIIQLRQIPSLLFPSLNEYEKAFGVGSSLSRHSTGAIFLTEFWQRRSLYNSVMAQTSVNSDDAWLSCDHTFASVSEFAMFVLCIAPY